MMFVSLLAVLMATSGLFFATSSTIAPRYWWTRQYFTGDSCQYETSFASEGFIVGECVEKSSGLGKALFQSQPQANSFRVDGQCSSLMIQYFTGSLCGSSTSIARIQVGVNFADVITTCKATEDATVVTQNAASVLHSCIEYPGDSTQVEAPLNSNSAVKMKYSQPPDDDGTSKCSFSQTIGFTAVKLNECHSDENGYFKYEATDAAGQYYNSLSKKTYTDSRCTIPKDTTLVAKDTCIVENSARHYKDIAVQALPYFGYAQLTSHLSLHYRIPTSDFGNSFGASVHLKNSFVDFVNVGSRPRSPAIKDSELTLDKILPEQLPTGRRSLRGSGLLGNAKALKSAIDTVEVIASYRLSIDMKNHPWYSSTTLVEQIQTRIEAFNTDPTTVETKVNANLREARTGIIVTSASTTTPEVTEPSGSTATPEIVSASSDSSGDGVTPIGLSTPATVSISIFFLLTCCGGCAALVYFSIYLYKKRVAERLLRTMKDEMPLFIESAPEESKPTSPRRGKSKNASRAASPRRAR